MNDKAQNDHAAQPLPFFLSWGAPLVILVSTNFMSGAVPLRGMVAIISGAFFWMELGLAFAGLAEP